MKSKETAEYPDLHQEHREWLSQLDFYQEEIRIFQTELSQVINQHPDLLSIIEHVDEYRLILQRKQAHIDEFRNRITGHDQSLAEQEDDAGGFTALHESMRSELEQFRQDLESFKRTFRRFVAYND